MPIKEKIAKENLLEILPHMRGSCGSCGMMEYSGLYGITSTKAAKNILRAAHKRQGNSDWNTFVICASSPTQTARIKKFMLNAGWEIIKMFKQAHSSGKMTLWGGYAIP